MLWHAGKSILTVARATNTRFPDVRIHESSYVDDPVTIGAGTVIWHFCHILGEVVIGRNCSIGKNVTIGPRVRLGDGCKIQNNVSIYEGVTLEEECVLRTELRIRERRQSSRLRVAQGRIQADPG